MAKRDKLSQGDGDGFERAGLGVAGVGNGVDQAERAITGEGGVDESE